MLKINNVHKSFHHNHVLQGVSLSIEQGDVVAIVGPSGSGKTTLLRCMNFLEKADAGTMDFGDIHTDLNRASHKTISEVRKRTAFVFQQYNLFKNKTALENVMEGLVTARKIPKAEAEETAKAALEKVGLIGKCGSYPSQLSGGQQQRVGIARAVAVKPDVILFDEPTSALDPELVGEVLSSIKALAAEGTTMAVVTHEIAFAKSIATKAVFMADGAIIEEGSPNIMFACPEKQRTKQFLRRFLEPEYSI